MHIYVHLWCLADVNEYINAVINVCIINVMINYYSALLFLILLAMKYIRTLYYKCTIHLLKIYPKLVGLVTESGTF